MSAQLSPSPKLRFFGTNGRPLSGGYLITYNYTTSQPETTWADADMTTRNPVQIQLDANGEPSVNGNPVSVFLEDGKKYKFRWFDNLGNYIGESEPVQTTYYADVVGDGAVGTQKVVEGGATYIHVYIKPNSIGRDLLKNAHNLVPDSRYLQFKDFDGKVVVTLCDSLQAWLETEGYTA